MRLDLKTLMEMPPWDWPVGTDARLDGVLRDTNASDSDRRQAAELAGDLIVMNDSLADALLSILGNSGESEALRAAAATSLGPVLEQCDADGIEPADNPPITSGTFRRIQERLRRLYEDDGTPRDVRRRCLEASVRATQDWHEDAVRAACASSDGAWTLTGVFCTRFVPGLDDQILNALDSANPDIRYEAVVAAGNWELDGAWDDVSSLVTSPSTEKYMRLAAIDAVASIRPHEAAAILADVADSDDEDIVAAVDEAMAMAEA